MSVYRVFWFTDIHANSPEEAAVEARNHQTDPNTTATIFEVLEKEPRTAGEAVCAAIDVLLDKHAAIVDVGEEKIDVGDL